MSDIHFEHETRHYTWKEAKGLTFPMDGFIIMQSNRDIPYTFRHYTYPYALMKFKFQHTVDVMINFDSHKQVFDSFFYVSGTTKTMHHDFHPIVLSPDVRNKVQSNLPETPICVECAYVSETDSWEGIRWRNDKSRSNSLHTIKHTMEVLSEAITVDSLVTRCKDLTVNFECATRRLTAPIVLWQTSSNSDIELEARILYQPDIPLQKATFDQIITRLRSRFGDERIIRTTDYFLPHGVRVTRNENDADDEESIVKSPISHCDFQVADSEVKQTFRLSLKSETPCKNPFSPDSMKTCRQREKHRHRFTHPEWFIDCTKVTDSVEGRIVYECEIEAREEGRQNNKKASDLCQSVIMKLMAYFYRKDATKMRYRLNPESLNRPRVKRKRLH
jgi:hypothetical protein